MKIIDNIKNLFKKELETEIAYSVPYSNRSPYNDFSLIQSLSPSVLANIFNDVKNGYSNKEYLELASDIELKAGEFRFRLC